MVFTSAIFLFAFLPVSLLAFYLAPPRWRTAPLLLTSAVFYAWGEPVLVVLILLTGLFTYWCGRQILAQPADHRRKTLLVLGIVVCLIPITIFKYLDFVLVQVHLPSLADQTQFPLPIGVSFYTFMAISYLIDIYRRRGTGAPSLLAFSGYLTMFPPLVAGPIVVAARQPDLVIVMHNQVSMLGNKQFDSGAWVDVKGTAKRLKGVKDSAG